ncbi:hypothetical protein GN956_G5197 [Arapaima gigas]
MSRVHPRQVPPLAVTRAEGDAGAARAADEEAAEAPVGTRPPAITHGLDARAVEERVKGMRANTERSCQRSPTCDERRGVERMETLPCASVWEKLRVSECHPPQHTAGFSVKGLKEGPSTFSLGYVAVASVSDIWWNELQ